MENRSDLDFKLDMPEFANEAEEAAWWPTQEDKLGEIFMEAAKNGTLRRARFVDGKAEPLPNDKAATPVTLRLPTGDVKLAKEQAAREGLPYQTYMKSLLHKALEAAR